MPDTVIHVDNLSKKYILGTGRSSDGLRHAIHNTVTAPLRWLAGRSAASQSDANKIGLASNHHKLEKEFWALRNVSLEIKQGEVVGIIGRNGAGKSTLLKILSRITEPTEGEVQITGRVASLLEVGTGFHPELTGRENVFLNGAILGMSRAEIKRKFDEIVAFAEVEKFLDTPVKRYSSGMYVRLAFAVAAHLEPEILIVDEVLAVGDAQFQKKCLGKMQSVSTKEGRTVLFVSHNMAAIKSLCTSGIYLKNGQVREIGDIDTAVSSYLSSVGNTESTPLGLRTDREGKGLVRMTRLWIEGTANSSVGSVTSGARVTFALAYESSIKMPLKNVRVSLGIQNLQEQNLILCSTELISASAHNCDPCGVIRCIIPKFPLSGGSYNLIAYFEVDGAAQDYVNNAATINVEDGDFYGSGKLYPPGWQGKSVLVEHFWEWPEPQTHKSEASHYQQETYEQQH